MAHSTAYSSASADSACCGEGKVVARTSCRLSRMVLFRDQRAKLRLSAWRSGARTRSAPRKCSSGRDAGAATFKTICSEQWAPMAMRRMAHSRVGPTGSSTHACSSMSSSMSQKSWCLASSNANLESAACRECPGLPVSASRGHWMSNGAGSVVRTCGSERG